MSYYRRTFFVAATAECEECKTLCPAMLRYTEDDYESEEKLEIESDSRTRVKREREYFEHWVCYVCALKEVKP